MTIFDSYLLRLFGKVLLICLVSITGLYIVIDFCNNMDEFLGYGKQFGHMRVIGEYYGARVPWFFDRISGLLVLVAAMFAVTWLQRTNEMSALMAAGIAKSRIIKPLIFAACVVSLLASANRELLIPRNRDQLLRNAQDWLGTNPRTLEPVFDYRTDILLSGKNTIAAGQQIEEPSFHLPDSLHQFGRKLSAATAEYRQADGSQPAGYLLRDVSLPEGINDLPTARLDGRPVIYCPSDTHWLDSDQCFVVSDVAFQQLAGGTQWRQLASTGELLQGLHNPSLDYGSDVRVTIHARAVQPLLDVTLFFLGIPLVLTRENRNIFVAAGWCILVVIGFFAVVMCCQALGNSGYLLDPTQAAWCPLIILAPCAAIASSPIFD